MRNLIFALALVPTLAIADPQVLVDYHYGNQILGSRLKIFADGGIFHEERTCCPPLFKPITQAALTENQLAQLKAWLEAAARSDVVVAEGRTSAHGSSSGTLRGYHDGKTVELHIVQRSNIVGPEGRDLVKQNQAPESQAIEALVESYTERDMYN